MEARLFQGPSDPPCSQRMGELPEGWTDEFLARVKSITAKRAKTVIDHILENGQVTSDELQNTYGYRHTARAIRDVRELGIPLESFRTKGADGRTINAYRFGNPTRIRGGTLSGRVPFPKELKASILAGRPSHCMVCLRRYESRYLQIDHRIPFEIAGEPGTMSPDPAEFMALCASCNRSKSWSCEHCPNWTIRSPLTCASCYWAHPESYSHIATEPVRRIELVWKGAEVLDFEKISAEALSQRLDLPTYLRETLRKRLLAHLETDEEKKGR